MTSSNAAHTMSGFYPSDQPPSPSSNHVPTQYYDRPPALPEQQSISSMHPARWFDLDSDNAKQTAKGLARVRRRPPPGSDHVKHRRTRSGCYTCRSRRVKCDEIHPTCKRCAKGSRECVYPDPSSGAKSGTGSKLQSSTEQGETSSGEYDEDDDQETSPAIAQGPAELSGAQWAQNTSHVDRPVAKKQSRQFANQAFFIASQLKETSLSPSTDESSALSKSRSTSTTLNSSEKQSSVSPMASQELPPWAHLQRHIQYYLDYHHQNLSYHHYFFKHDQSDFVHNTLIDTALEYEPLLYAVVGFASFHLTTRKPNGKVQDFLGYYNRSVKLLLRSLKAGEKHHDATLLTILQLAAFEEYLGDWVNLLSHQKAAYEMLLELYSPETIMQTETSRRILSWYTRFDLFAGLMSNNKTVLGRDWMAASEKFYTALARQDPTSLDYRIESNIATHRLIAIDMAQLFGKLSKGDISMGDFLEENEIIAHRIHQLRQVFGPLLDNTEHRVMSFEGAPERDPNDIVDPYVPGLLYSGPLWNVNFMQLNWHGVEVMHKYQTSMLLQQPPPSDLQQLALEQCRLLEAIEFWPGSPPGAVLPAQASLGLNCLFLPRDEKHIMWCRRKLAKFESMGYIYPATFRTKMADLWNIPELEYWWLPNEEGYPPIIKSIRAFIEERTRETRDQGSEDVRNMKGMFSRLNVGDSPQDSHSPDSSSSGLGGELGFGRGSSSMAPPFEQGGIDQRLSGMEPGPTIFDSKMQGEEMWLDATGQHDWSAGDLNSQPAFYHPPRS